jgi:glycosyltransferase involved in cell wall biosynthesis
MSVATDLVLKVLNQNVSVIHLDTADRRGLSNIGRFDLRNVTLAVYHIFKYFWILVFRNPQIVYVPIAQDPLAFLRDSLFLIPARLLKKKIVIHLHGGYFATFYQSARPLMKRLIRYSLEESQRAIVLGTSLGNIFDGILSSERVRVIPNGIPDHFGETDLHNGHRRTILFLSTLMREKGVCDVIAALPRILELVPDVRAVFAGEWFRSDDRQQAEAMVRELQLGSHVDFIGPVVPPRKYELLRTAELFVMPTTYKNEGHPYVILEAMSAGLPVISTNKGCITETVIDGANGFIVQPGNSEELARRVVSLLTDESLRRKMGEASRKRYLERYTLDRFSDQLNNLFQEVGGRVVSYAECNS